MEQLGKVNGEIWPETGRVRFVIDHPMDTGLANGIPVFIIDDLRLADNNNREIARMELGEPVSEDPAFTFYLDKKTIGSAVNLHARDNSGNVFDATLEHRALKLNHFDGMRFGSLPGGFR